MIFDKKEKRKKKHKKHFLFFLWIFLTTFTIYIYIFLIQSVKFKLIFSSRSDHFHLLNENCLIRMNNSTMSTAMITKESILILNNTYAIRAEKNLMALDTAALLLYSLLAMVLLILTLLVILAISLNKKSKVEADNKYTSFINLRKSKDSGQYR